VTPREVDVHKLPAMLTALRLPSFQAHWQAFAARADDEGWSAAGFLAALAECELAERETRRIQRHLGESRLPAGKTLATFDFDALTTVPRRRIEALAAGDWIDGGHNLVAIGNSGAGKSHILAAVGHALIEAGYRVLYARTTELVQRSPGSTSSTSSSSTTSPTPRRIRPRAPSSSNSSQGATRPRASPSPPTSPSAPGNGSSPTKPWPSPPSTASSTTPPSSR
jgi:hypothetical protein